jgi:hypothetical protein
MLIDSLVRTLKLVKVWRHYYIDFEVLYRRLLGVTVHVELSTIARCLTYIYS